MLEKNHRFCWIHPKKSARFFFFAGDSYKSFIEIVDVYLEWRDDGEMMFFWSLRQLDILGNWKGRPEKSDSQVGGFSNLFLDLKRWHFCF